MLGHVFVMLFLLAPSFRKDPLSRNEFEECCKPPTGQTPSPYCFNIDVPADDPFFSRFGVRCIDFVRGFPGVRHGCRLGKTYDRFLKTMKLLNSNQFKHYDT